MSKSDDNRRGILKEYLVAKFRERYNFTEDLSCRKRMIDLGMSAGVSRSAIYNLIGGNSLTITLDTFKKLATVIDIDLAWLTDRNLIIVPTKRPYEAMDDLFVEKNVITEVEKDIPTYDITKSALEAIKQVSDMEREPLNFLEYLSKCLFGIIPSELKKKEKTRLKKAFKICGFRSLYNTIMKDPDMKIPEHVLQSLTKSIPNLSYEFVFSQKWIEENVDKTSKVQNHQIESKKKHFENVKLHFQKLLEERKYEWDDLCVQIRVENLTADQVAELEKMYREFHITVVNKAKVPEYDETTINDEAREKLLYGVVKIPYNEQVYEENTNALTELEGVYEVEDDYGCMEEEITSDIIEEVERIVQEGTNQEEKLLPVPKSLNDIKTDFLKPIEWRKNLWWIATEISRLAGYQSYHHAVLNFLKKKSMVYGKDYISLEGQDMQDFRNDMQTFAVHRENPVIKNSSKLTLFSLTGVKLFLISSPTTFGEFIRRRITEDIMPVYEKMGYFVPEISNRSNEKSASWMDDTEKLNLFLSKTPPLQTVLSLMEKCGIDETEQLRYIEKFYRAIGINISFPIKCDRLYYLPSEISHMLGIQSINAYDNARAVNIIIDKLKIDRDKLTKVSQVTISLKNYFITEEAARFSEKYDQMSIHIGENFNEINTVNLLRRICGSRGKAWEKEFMAKCEYREYRDRQVIEVRFHISVIPQIYNWLLDKQLPANIYDPVNQETINIRYKTISTDFYYLFPEEREKRLPLSNKYNK